MESIWEKTVRMPEYPKFSGEEKTDVLIVGGGITGILCACFLKRAGLDTILLEADRICGGVTKNTTAKITFQHGLIYDKLINLFGTEKAQMYLAANRDALLKYKELCKDINCEFEEKDAILYSCGNPVNIEKEINALSKIGYKADYINKTPLPFEISGAEVFHNQAQFNPLKFLSVVAAEINIYEKSRVLNVSGNTAFTDGGKIHAAKIIVATHFPFIDKHGLYFLKMYQQRSYVLALKNAENIDGMYIGEGEETLSFRNYKDYLLLGGGGHRTGKKGGGFSELLRFKDKYYKNSDASCAFAAQDCITPDGVPYIGNYSKKTADLFVATGFNKWGMTSSMAAAKILLDLVLERENPYAPVFATERSFCYPQTAKNAFEAFVHIITPTAPRCPHLGCALKWNKEEKTWDCACHGSRFSVNGEVIDNPANGNMKKMR